MDNCKLLVSLAMVFSSFSAASAALQEEPIQAGVQQCALDLDDVKRLACFDSLASSLLTQGAETEDSQTGLPDTLGGGKFDDRNLLDEGNRGLVTTCKESLDGRWFFIFENGQVWKQVNRDRRPRRYKGCELDVVIREDGFGYRMRIDKLDREIRVKRIR